MKKHHTTKDGRKIKISDLETIHLLNIIKWIEKKSIDGITVRDGGGSCADDIWCDEETFFGDEAKEMLGYSSYKSELSKRSVTI